MKARLAILLFGIARLILIAVCACGDSEWSDQAPRASAASLAGENCRYGSSWHGVSLVECQRQGWQLDVAIRAVRTYDGNGAIIGSRSPSTGDKGVLIQEEGIWYLDVFPEK